ncbi:MAG: NYN domain-containing protein [Euryarchaeota archaeon]|nr:NYN domain-containing protein [Euryarchaeota archaeon]
MSSEQLAIYLDFENLAISADQAFSHIERPLKLGPLLDYGAAKGTISIKKAYADWARPDNNRYIRHLIKYGFELKYLPGTSHRGKNGADIQISIDVLEDMQFYPLDAVVIGSGDTDFLPLIRRVLARGKKVYLTGFDDSVGDIIRDNCSEYQSLDTLLSGFLLPNLDDNEEHEEGSDVWMSSLRKGRDLLIRYIRSKNPDEPVLYSLLKNELLRLQPSFSEESFGFRSFTEFMESFEGDLIAEISTSSLGHPQVLFKRSGDIPLQSACTKDEVLEFIAKNLRYPFDMEIRLELSRYLLACFIERSPVSMTDMINFISEHMARMPRLTIRKFLFALGEGRAFHYAEPMFHQSLQHRPQILNRGVSTPEQIEEIYRKRILEIARNRFSGSEMDLIEERFFSLSFRDQMK